MTSKGEEKIAKLLKSARIPFKQEVSFYDLKNLKGNLLRFDFAIFKNNKIVFLLEYDGEQHFHQVSHFQKTIFNFMQARENDRIKNAYCLRKNIPLIRVPYWDYEDLTLEKILTNPLYRVTNKYHNDILIRR